MVLDELAKRYGDRHGPREMVQHEMERSAFVENTIRPFVRGETIEGITLATVDETELAILSDGIRLDEATPLPARLQEIPD